MHEQVIAKSIIKEAQKHGKVVGIEVEVGELAHIPAHELKDALALTGWKLNIKEMPSVIGCECEFYGRPNIIEKGHDSTIFECPRCKAKLPRIVAGDQIVLVGVDIEE
ncbi:hypothetical protein GOV10_06650 [Candidatus Woesearchaeota archaeon]|nr:hypothetical protein [Candidatus Woesearchaeota archaeon]